MSAPTMGTPTIPELIMVEIEYSKSFHVAALSPVQWAVCAPDPTNVDLRERKEEKNKRSDDMMYQSNTTRIRALQEC
jgi:hypothetical protein